MEGHWETRRGEPLILFGWPDMAAETTRYAVEVPKLGSLILTHDWNGEVKGLKAWPAAERPNSPIVFWSFRIMVGVGVLMVLLGLWSLLLRLRGRLYDSRMLLRFAVLMGPSGFVAVLAGWITTEVGRQPYTVYGLLRTADSVSPIALPGVASSLVAFIVVYFAVFGAGILYILRLMAHTPQSTSPTSSPACRCAPPASRPRRRLPQRPGREAEPMIFDLAFIWAGLIAFAVLAYVLFDGFDLGIGILFPFLGPERNRDQAMNSVAPVWDGNETWLVLGGGGLMAAFPRRLRCRDDRALCADHRHAAGARLPRRRLRVPLARRAPRPAGTGRSPAARCWRPSRRAWRSARWCRASRSPTAPMPAAGGTG